MAFVDTLKNLLSGVKVPVAMHTNCPLLIGVNVSIAMETMLDPVYICVMKQLDHLVGMPTQVTGT